MDIAGYTVIEPLGHNNVSDVMLAKRDGFRARYAIRMLKETATANAEAALAFLHGAKLAADTCHPHLAKIHHYGQHEGKPYYVMDYISPGALHKKAQDLCLLDSIYIVKQAAEALEYLAKFGMSHGSVNPFNIFVQEQNSAVLLTGFGFASCASAFPEEKRFSFPAACYMSPEQLIAGVATPQSDTYSLGAVFYSLLAGGPPHQASTIAELRRRVEGSPTAKLPASKQVFDEILRRALAKNPAERYSSITEFVSAIEGVSDEDILKADFISVDGSGADLAPETLGNPAAAERRGTATGSGNIVSLVQKREVNSPGSSGFSAAPQDSNKTSRADSEGGLKDGLATESEGKGAELLHLFTPFEAETESEPKPKGAPIAGRPKLKPVKEPNDRDADTEDNARLQKTPEQQTAEKLRPVTPKTATDPRPGPRQGNRPRPKSPQRRPPSSGRPGATRGPERSEAFLAATDAINKNRTRHTERAAPQNRAARPADQKTSPVLLLILVMTLVFALSMSLLPPDIQLRIYQDFIEPARHSIAFFFDEITGWFEQLKSN